MDAMEVAAVLRRAAENAGCGLHEVVTGGGDCPEGSCNGCREASAAWANEAADAIERCSLPEGVEWLLEVWPRWSNGDYCRFGDWWTADRYGEGETRQLRRLVIYTPELLDEWEQGDGESYGYEWDFMRPSELDYRPDKVEPPAPAALAADGEPLEVGQTVWDTNGDELVVGSLEDGGHTVTCRYADVGDGIPVHGMWSPSGLTHQRPVLDADGVPIRKGDTVFRASDGREFEVTGIGGAFTIRVKDESMELGIWTTPCGFTHAKPEQDTWERLYLDMDNGRMTMDEFVCRAKALAERGER